MLRNSHSGQTILWEHMQIITCSMYLQATGVNLFSPSDTSHRPHQANKQWSSLEVSLENRSVSWV